MTWRVEIGRKAQRNLDKLNPQIADRIREFLDNLVTRYENPRDIGIALEGLGGGLWRYRVGNYRIFVEIEDKRLIILVVGVGHRSDIYHKFRRRPS